MDNEKEYNPDIITVSDDNGNDHTFEELDRIETDKGRYVALLPVYDDFDDVLDSDGELIILRVEEEDGETYLAPIEEDDEFNEVGDIFEKRLSEMFGIDVIDAEDLD